MALLWAGISPLLATLFWLLLWVMIGEGGWGCCLAAGHACKAPTCSRRIGCVGQACICSRDACASLAYHVCSAVHGARLCMAGNRSPWALKASCDATGHAGCACLHAQPVTQQPHYKASAALDTHCLLLCLEGLCNLSMPHRLLSEFLLVGSPSSCIVCSDSSCCRLLWPLSQLLAG